MSSEAQDSSSGNYSKNPLPSPSLSIQFLDYVLPIKGRELPKFLSLALLMFCILGIQNLIRAMKDSVINTMIGTETISFLKLGVIPAALLIAIIYVKLISIMKGENIFYLILSVFLGFFTLFAFVLFPNHQSIHLEPAYVEELSNLYPHFKWLILIFANWSFSLFYIISELWSNVMFALLYWQFVNKITTVNESRRFYPLFSILGQTSLALSGVFLLNLVAIDDFITELFSLESNQSIVSVQIVITVATLLGITSLLTFRVINHKILDISTTENLQFRAKKNQISLKESFKMISRSRHIRLITLLLLCYGIAINLVEGPWKSEARKIYTTPTEYAIFVGSYLKYTGLLTLAFALMGSIIVRSLGWFAAAIITPFIVFITGMSFFLVSNFDKVSAFASIFFLLTNPISIAVSVGAIQNILSKSSKYILFDSTKEMSYVPLEDELKTRGKAAADMIGLKLGKSSSAFLQSMTFTIIPTATYSSISSSLMVIFFFICTIWIWAVVELNKEYKNACRKKEEESVF